MGKKFFIRPFLKYLWFSLLVIIGFWGWGVVYYNTTGSAELRMTAAVIYPVIVLFLLIGAFRGNYCAARHLTVIELLTVFHFILLTPEEVFRDTIW